ncbi:MAG TPA: prepilin-type N-terminal cleavage/methylation domain-containing protein [Burkholderiaceae bacterium]
MKQLPSTPLTRRQRGATLIEALVAMLIMAFGMLALVGLQSSLRRSGDVAKQRGDATKIVQLDVENLRDFSAPVAASAPASSNAYDQLANASNDDAGFAPGNASYSLSRQVLAVAEPPMTLVNVEVKWKDRGWKVGDPEQSVNFGTIVAKTDAALSGSLSIAPNGDPNRRPMGRSVAIPIGAKDVGGGLSAWKPVEGGTLAWVFNNITGVIVGICSTITTSTSLITAADISACNANASALLLSGYVSYSFTSPPADPPADALIVPTPVLTLTSEGHLTPAYQCFVRTPSTTVAAYYCAVYPNSSSLWSGKLTLDGLGARKVCRYSADYDGNGSISNAEHPESYVDVKVPLTRQNFLVINLAETCPAGHGVDLSLNQYSNTATLQIQP